MQRAVACLVVEITLTEMARMQIVLQPVEHPPAFDIGKVYASVTAAGLYSAASASAVTPSDVVILHAFFATASRR